MSDSASETGAANPNARGLVIMPARNEATRIGDVIDGVSRALPGARVLVIDDASQDETVDVARAAGAMVAPLPIHLGYGGALQTGYHFAVRRNCTWLIQMDSDGQHRPEDLPALLAPVLDGRCDLAIGSRFAPREDETPGYEMDAVRSLGRRSLALLGRLGGVHVTDPTSGLQAMNAAALELFTSSWYPVDYPDIDVLLLAHRRGLRLCEVPVTMRPSPRPSMLHSGWMPVYYAYRMLLSLWALSAIPRSEGPESGSGRGRDSRGG